MDAVSERERDVPLPFIIDGGANTSREHQEKQGEKSIIDSMWKSRWPEKREREKIQSEKLACSHVLFDPGKRFGISIPGRFFRQPLTHFHRFVSLSLSLSHCLLPSSPRKPLLQQLSHSKRMHIHTHLSFASSEQFEAMKNGK